MKFWGEEERSTFVMANNPDSLMLSLDWSLYDKVLDNNVVEWQLQFQDARDTSGSPKIVAESSIRKMELTKRKIDKIRATTVLDSESRKLVLFLATDGRFILKTGEIRPGGLKGTFSVENIDYKKKRIRLIPKYGNAFPVADQTRSSGSITLHEIMLIIFQYAISPPITFHAGKFKQLKNLGLVCKYWFKLLTKTFDKLDGEVEQTETHTKIRFNGWLMFSASGPFQFQ